MDRSGIFSQHGSFALAVVFATAACLFIPTRARAEMPLSAYQAFQREAPEVLEVEFTSVEQSNAETVEETITAVTLLAKVLTVKRTATKLKVGATITIAYEVRKSKQPGWVGPSRLPIPGKGEKCPAWLKLTKDKPPTYSPAAGGYTFHTVKA